MFENSAGLTPEDLAKWLPPGLPTELECEAFLGYELEPADRQVSVRS